MKHLLKLKLTQLSNSELEKKALNKLKGGGCCICGCVGPSGILDNAAENNQGGLYSPGGGYGTGADG